MKSRHAIGERSRIARALGLLATAGLATVLIAGCGDDDEKSAQETYCEAGESLEASVGTLTNLDLVAEGANGLESALDSIESDVNELSDAATDAAAADVDALDQSVDDLSNALSDLGGEITSENVTAVATAVGAVGDAAQGVYNTLSDCS